MAEAPRTATHQGAFSLRTTARSLCPAGRAGGLLACPICAAPEGTLMSEGARAGALVLIVITAIVVLPMVWYGVRLWRTEREDR